MPPRLHKNVTCEYISHCLKLNNDITSHCRFSHSAVGTSQRRRLLSLRGNGPNTHPARTSSSRLPSIAVVDHPKPNMDRTKPVAVASTKTNGTRPAKQNAQKWQRARQAPDPKFPPSRHPWKPYVRSRSTPPGSTRLQDECITLRGTRSFYHPDELRFPIHTTYEDRTVQPRHQGLSRGPYSRAGHSRGEALLFSPLSGH